MSSLSAPEERFGKLFEAAQVLLRVGIDEEDVIYPTLMYANERGRGTRIGFPSELPGGGMQTLEEYALILASGQDGEGWDSACRWFLRNHDGAVPIDAVDGVVILRRPNVDGGVYMYPNRDVEIQERVIVRLLPYTSVPSSEIIAATYEDILRGYNVTYGEHPAGSIGYELTEDALLVTAYAAADMERRISAERAAPVFGSDLKPDFPRPSLMAAFCRLLLDNGFAGHLADRRRGKAPNPAALVAACVAFCLKIYGGVRGKTAHRLLNKHLSGFISELPEVGSSTAASVKLWRDADKAADKLLPAAHAFYDHDLEYTAWLVPDHGNRTSFD